MKCEKWKGMFVEIEDFVAVDDGSIIVYGRLTPL